MEQVIETFGSTTLILIPRLIAEINEILVNLPKEWVDERDD